MSWPEDVAGQRLDDVLCAAERDGPQIIDRNGEGVAVVIDVADYRRLTGGEEGLRP